MLAEGRVRVVTGGEAPSSSSSSSACKEEGSDSAGVKSLVAEALLAEATPSQKPADAAGSVGGRVLVASGAAAVAMGATDVAAGLSAGE